MLRKSAVVCVALLSLIGVSYVRCDEGAETEAAPSIRELEEFLRAAEEAVPFNADREISRARDRLKNGEPEAAQDILLRASQHALTDKQRALADDLLAQADTAIRAEKASAMDEQLSMRARVERQMRQTRAAELALEARHLFYQENKVEEAYALAVQALLYDPENAEALKLKTEAGAALGVPTDRQRLEAERLAQLPSRRQESALQLLETTLSNARGLYEAGQYDESLELLRRARLYVQTLAAYMDVTRQRQEVEGTIQIVEEDRERAQLELAVRRRTQVKAMEDETARAITEEELMKKQRLVEQVLDLMDRKAFRETDSLLKELEYDDPSDDLVRLLRQKYRERRYEYLMDQANARGEEGDLQHEIWETERELTPKAIFDYPVLPFWRDIVGERWKLTPDKRELAYIYPSVREVLERTPVDQAVYDGLDKEYDFIFEKGQLLSEVVDYIDEVTEVSAVGRGDLDIELPARFRMKTTLQTALEHMTEMTGTAWKVHRGAVVIGSPEEVADYVFRVYPIRDLLLSFQDATVSGFGSIDTGDGDEGEEGEEDFEGTFQFRPSTLAQFDETDSNQDDDEGDETATELYERTVAVRNLLESICATEPWAWLTTHPESEDWEGQAFGGATGGGGGGGGFFEGVGGFGFGEEAGGAFGAPAAPAAGGTTGVRKRPGADYLPHDPGVLVVYDTIEVHECVEQMLKELRARINIQVMVDLRFLSVDTDFMREVGFNWDQWTPYSGTEFTAGGALDGFGVSTPGYGGYVVDSSGMYIARGVAAGTGKIGGTGLPFVSTPDIGTTLNLAYSKGTFGLTGMFRLAHQRNAVRTLSAPRIMLANGQEGVIRTTTEQVYISGYSISDGVPVPTRSTLPRTIQLVVRPVVSHDLRYVFLELSPTRSDFELGTPVDYTVGIPGTGADGGGESVTFTNPIYMPTRSSEDIRTTVAVPDRGTVICGGLSTSSKSEHEGGIPILDKIPFVKALVTAKGRMVDRETLFIMASPQIVLLEEEEKSME